MSNINHIIVEGFVVRDPELRTTKTGISVCSIIIGNNVYQGKDRAEKVNFFQVQTWRHIADYVSRNCGKGTRVIVEGELSQTIYDGRDGEKKYSNDIVARRVLICSPGRAAANALNEPEPVEETPFPGDESPAF